MFPASSFTERADACDQPPQIANATIIHEATQKVFATGFQLGYICKEGHSIEEGSSKGLITCESGEWTMAPPCSRVSKCSKFPL